LASTLTIARDVFDSSSLVVSTSSTLFDADSIKIAFNVATFFPQLPWLFLIFLPNGGVTRRLLGGYGKRGAVVSDLVYGSFFLFLFFVRWKKGRSPGGRKDSSS
jgi:hypothetical protein